MTQPQTPSDPSTNPTNADGAVENEDTLTPPAEAVEEVEEPEVQESTADETSAEDDERDAELPEWARDKMTKANKEAARYRTELRDVQAKLAEAKTPEEFAAVTKDFGDKITALEREVVAAKFKLPSDLAEVLKGGSREEMEAHAKILQQYAPAEESGPSDVSGGLNPSAPGSPGGDPRELARKYRRRY